MLVPVEGLHGHEVGERVVGVVVRGQEVRHGAQVQHGLRVHAGEEGVVQDAASGAFLHAKAPMKGNRSRKYTHKQGMLASLRKNEHKCMLVRCKWK